MAERTQHLADLLGKALFAYAVSVLGMVLIDGVFALLGRGTFGDLNGWLGLVFPAIIFGEQFRAAKGERGRLAVLLVSAVVAIGLGAGVAFALTSINAGWPPLASGAAAALFATIIYAGLWHIGLALLRA